MSFDSRFDTITVTGTSTLNSTLSIQGDVYMTSSLSVGEDLFANQCTLNSLITSSLSVFSIVSGTVTLQEDLTILDDLVVHDTVSVGGQVRLSSTLSVADRVTLRSSLSVDSNVGISSSLSVGNHTHLSSTLSVTGSANIGGSVYQAGALLVPTGTILLYSVSSSPDGYLICNGAAVSRTTYANLFSVIGTTFGVGNGATTFNLPNMEDRLPYGFKTGAGIGTTGGSETVTITTNNLPAHTHTGTTDSSGNHSHTVTDPGHTHSQTTINDDYNNSGGNPPGFSADSAGSVTWNNINSSTTGISINSNGAHTHTFTTGSTGSGTAVTILNPYMRLAYIIKY